MQTKEIDKAVIAILGHIETAPLPNYGFGSRANAAHAGQAYCPNDQLKAPIRVQYGTKQYYWVEGAQ